MAPLVCVLLFLGIFGQSFGEKTTEFTKRRIYCTDVQTPFDAGKAVGFWFEVAFTATTKPQNIGNRDACMTAEFIGINRVNSTDVVFKIDFNLIMSFRNVEGLGTGGCYQRVKNLDDTIIDSRTAQESNVMMTQFHLVETKKDLFLVQVIWETKELNEVNIIYKRNQDTKVQEEDLEPVYTFIKRIKGPQNWTQYCINDDNNIL